MAQEAYVPQSTVLDPDGRPSRAWLQWLLNPKLQTINLQQAIGVSSGGTGLSSGIPGGVLAFTGTTTIASSAALALNGVVVGGGTDVPTSTDPLSGGQIVVGQASGPPMALDMTGDVKISPLGVTLIQPQVVSNDKLALTAAQTVKGNALTSVAGVSDIQIPDNLSALINAEVSVTAAVSLLASAFGKMHVCLGTTADYTVTLPPVLLNAGLYIGFRMTPGLTRLVTIKGNAAELIDGLNTRVMWASETATLYCNGSTWTKTSGRAIPMSVALQRTAAQSISTATWTAVSTNVLVRDNTSSLAVPAGDLTNGRYKVLRPGLYQASGFVSFSGVTSGAEMSAGCSLNASTPGDNPNAFATSVAGSSTNCAITGSGVFQATAGQFINAICFNADSASRNTRTTAASLPTLSVTEMVNW